MGDYPLSNDHGMTISNTIDSGRLPNELIEALAPLREILHGPAHNAVFPVIGSGLSHGLDSWHTLLASLVRLAPTTDRPELEDALRRGAYLEVAGFLEAEAVIGREGIAAVIRARYQRPRCPRPPIFDGLTRLPAQHFATTNYDPWLKDAVGQHLGLTPRVYTPSDPGAFADIGPGSPPLVLMLHGDADRPESCVLSAKGYRRLIHGDVAYRHGLAALLAQRHWLFVGQSLRDPDFTSLLEAFAEVFGTAGSAGAPRHFLLGVGITNIERRRLLDFGVQPIEYGPKGDHTRLPDVIQHLAEPATNGLVAVGAPPADTSTDAAGPPITINEEPESPLDRIRGCVEGLYALLEALRSATPSSDTFLGILADYHDQASLMINDLNYVANHDAALLADLEPSILSGKHITQELISVLSATRTAAACEIVDGFLTQMSRAVIAPIDGYLVRADAQRQMAELEDDCAAMLEPDSMYPERGGSGVEDLLLALERGDDLARHEAALRTAATHYDAVITRLQAIDRTQLQRVLAGLWAYADSILMQGGPGPKVLLRYAAQLRSDDEVTQRWHALYQAFTPNLPIESREELERLVTSGRPETRRVLARCLLVNSNAELRQLAIERLQTADLWYAITWDRLSRQRLLELWRVMRRSSSREALKIFFIVVRETLSRCINARQVVPTVELVKEFFNVDGFHEDSVFGRLVQLGRDVTREALVYGLRLDLDTEFAERFKTFQALGRAPDRRGNIWDSVPLPVQRLLARRGFFIDIFMSSVQDVIALECLPYIKQRRDGGRAVRQRSINGHLLTLLAKERSLFSEEEDRHNLVAHPKSNADIIHRYLYMLSPASLNKLLMSHECTVFAREAARRRLSSLGKTFRPAK